MSERIVNIGCIEGEMEDFIRKNKDSERKHVVTESSNTSQLSGDFPRNKEEEDWIYKILKAGVPMIIIPFFGDQPFNATLAEYLGIGISIKPRDFVNEFKETVDKIMGSNSYQENAQKIAKAIKKAKYGQIDIFLNIVKKAIEEEVEEESPFPEMPLNVTTEYLKLDELDTIVGKFLKSISFSKIKF
uniref:glucuronosyltransferase n=1 Tax=Meloidogyne javanica TaxID=6303 RepID=A0A915M872_MELJA